MAVSVVVDGRVKPTVRPSTKDERVQVQVALRGPATRSLSQRTSNSDPVTTNVFIGRNSLLYLLLVLLRAGGALICIPCDRGPLKVHQL